MSTSPISLLNPSSTVTDPSITATAASSAAPTEADFLQLLVAQLKYRDPSQPADGTQFVTELAQFTDVANTTSMSGDLGSILGIMQTATTPATSGDSTTNPVPNS